MDMNEKFKKVVELGQMSAKESTKSTQTFWDIASSTDIDDDLDMLIYDRARTYANADARFTNKCRTTAQKIIREQVKARKETE